jgi:hypothetical protein
MELVGLIILGGLCLLWIIPPYWKWASTVLSITPYPNVNGVIVTVGIIAVIGCVCAIANSEMDEKIEKIGRAIATIIRAVCLIVIVVGVVALLFIWLFSR